MPGEVNADPIEAWAETPVSTKARARLLFWSGAPLMLLAPHMAWAALMIPAAILTRPAELFTHFGAQVTGGIALYFAGIWVWVDFRRSDKNRMDRETISRIWIRSIIVNALWSLFFPVWWKSFADGRTIYWIMACLVPVFFLVVSVDALLANRLNTRRPLAAMVQSAVSSLRDASGTAISRIKRRL